MKFLSKLWWTSRRIQKIVSLSSRVIINKLLKVSRQIFLKGDARSEKIFLP